MDVMFWVWIGIIVLTVILELATMELVSIWFTFGAIVPLILAATKAVGAEIQIIIFIVISAILIISLRKITKKWLLKNSNEKTNTDALIGQKFKMLEKTDFETVGTVKVNGVVWSAIEENREIIEKDQLVEIVKISGNKLIVKKIESKGENV